MKKVIVLKIKSIEPTPSPNTMKINLDEELPMGASHNYKKDSSEGAPLVIQTILQIEGIKGVYHVADFLAIERNAKYDWKILLPPVRQAFGEELSESAQMKQNEPTDHFGEVRVQVQIFKDIPLQIKLTDGTTEERFGMPDYFLKAREQAQLPQDNYILLRKWQDQGVRYGKLNQIGQEVVDELVAAYPPERIQDLVKKAQAGEINSSKRDHTRLKKISLSEFNNPDWQIRYRLLEQMDNPTLADLPVLEKALQDEKVSIRRLAAAYLGMIDDKMVLPFLYKALKDKAVTVRRTAGDCLSDLGFAEAEEEMMKALQDESNLVRWRAAMFLYEIGDKQALPALKAAENDPEFEVSMQAKLAIERIEGGIEAKGSVWKQMTDIRKS
jgi:hypothetical protein